MEDKFWEEDALQESYIEEFIIQVGDSDEEDSNSDSDISGSSKESDDLSFMLSVFFNRSCQWWCEHSKSHLDHSWVMHFFLIAFVCSHPTFECYIYIHVKCIIYNVNCIIFIYLHSCCLCFFNRSCQWWCGHSKSHLDHSWVLHIFCSLLLFAVIPHLSATYYTCKMYYL